MYWSRQLAAFRNKHGLKQVQLAERLDVDERIVRRWEKGLAQPSPRYQQRIQSLMLETGDALPIGKQHFHCDNDVCVYGLPIAAAQPSSLSSTGSNGHPFQAVCGGLCDHVHEKVLAHFSAEIADSNVMSLKAQFDGVAGGNARRISVYYNFLRQLAEPVLVAECRVTPLQDDASPATAEFHHVEIIRSASTPQQRTEHG